MIYLPEFRRSLWSLRRAQGDPLVFLDSLARSLMTHFAIAFAGYTTVTMLLFRGLIGRFSVAVPSDLGDPLLSTWVLWCHTAHTLPFMDPADTHPKIRSEGLSASEVIHALLTIRLG